MPREEVLAVVLSFADQLSPEARATLEQVERLHGGPARTLMITGWRVAIDEGQP